MATFIRLNDRGSYNGRYLNLDHVVDTRWSSSGGGAEDDALIVRVAVFDHGAPDDGHGGKLVELTFSDDAASAIDSAIEKQIRAVPVTYVAHLEE